MSEVLPKCLLFVTYNSRQILIKFELFHADGRIDGQTDMTKLLSVFRNFANALTSDHKCTYAKHIINSGRPVKIKVARWFQQKKIGNVNKNLSTKRNIHLIYVS